MQLDRKVQPHIFDAVDFEYKLPPINHTVLDNGIPLYWLNGGVQNVVEINWVFPAGLWYEDKEAIAGTVAALLKNGTATYTAHQISEAFEYYGATLKTSAGNDTASVTLHSLVSHLPHILPIVLELIAGAEFPSGEISIHQQNSLQRLMVSLRQCEFVANQKIDAAIFGEKHPYGRFTKKEAIEAIQREDLIRFHKNNYDLSHVTMFMGGKVGEAEVALLNSIFGQQPLTKEERTVPAYTIESQGPVKERFVNDPAGVQGAIRCGKQGLLRTDPDFAGMVVLNTIFGGYFGSRLMSNIREEKGFTYGIYSSLTPMKHAGIITIHTEVGKDVIAPALEEIYKEMELLRREPVDEEELLLVKNYLLGNILGDLDGPFSILQRWRTLILNGFTEEKFNENIRIYKTIGTEELLQLAGKHFNPADFTEIVVV